MRCYFLLFFVIFCNFAVFFKILLMDRQEFEAFNEAAFDTFGAIVDKVHNEPGHRRYWAAKDTKDGGRVYVEYRRAML